MNNPEMRPQEPLRGPETPDPRLPRPGAPELHDAWNGRLRPLRGGPASGSHRRNRRLAWRLPDGHDVLLRMRQQALPKAAWHGNTCTGSNDPAPPNRQCPSGHHGPTGRRRLLTGPCAQRSGFGVAHIFGKTSGPHYSRDPPGAPNFDAGLRAQMMAGFRAEIAAAAAVQYGLPIEGAR
jgi:hypothetical protein